MIPIYLDLTKHVNLQTQILTGYDRVWALIHQLECWGWNKNLFWWGVMVSCFVISTGLPCCMTLYWYWYFFASTDVGSTPVISAVNLENGNVNLECQSEGWSTSPQLEWLDSKGHILLAEPPCVQSLPEGLRVKSTVTVEEGNGNIIRCRVRSSAQNKETKFNVSCE